MTTYPSNDSYNTSNVNNDNTSGSGPLHSGESIHSDSSHMIPHSDTQPPSVPYNTYGSQSNTYDSQNSPYGSQSSVYGSQSHQYGSAPLQGHTGSQEASPYGSQPAEYNPSDMYGYGGSSLHPNYSGEQQTAHMQDYNSQQYYHPGQPGTYVQTGQTNTMSLLSLVISCISIFTGGILAIVGVILGHIGLKQIKISGEDGRGLALAGLIIGYVQVAFIAIFIAFFFLLMIIGIASA